MDKKAIHSPEKQIIGLFPEFKTQIKLLFQEEDAGFQELVEDFLFCQLEFRRLTKSGKMDTAHQYHITMEELRNELIKYFTHT